MSKIIKIIDEREREKNRQKETEGCKLYWVDGISKCGWCLAGGRGCWLKGSHQNPSVSWIFSSFLTLPHVLDCLICTRNFVTIFLLLWMMRGWDRWGVVDSHQGVGGGTGVGYYLIVFLGFFICAFIFWSLMSCLLSEWVEHDGCCVCFFVHYLFSLSLVPLTRSYWGIEIL